MTIYVDGNLLTGNDPELIAQIKCSIHKRIVFKDFGEVQHTPGIHSLYLDQQEYAQSILERFGMGECNSTHLQGKIIPPDDNTPPLDTDHKRRFQEITGALDI
ncbi:unnamed protein product [Discosporangium mesarthrocarpum]